MHVIDPNRPFIFYLPDLFYLVLLSDCSPAATAVARGSSNGMPVEAAMDRSSSSAGPKGSAIEGGCASATGSWPITCPFLKV